MGLDYEKYMMAKRILGYNLCVNKAKKLDGKIDEYNLDELLKQNYNYMKERLLRIKSAENEIEEIDYLYSMIKNKQVRNINEQFAKEEEYAKRLKNECKTDYIGKIKNYTIEQNYEKDYHFEVFPEKENGKHILIIPKRKYKYTTQLGVIAYINEYEIIKNINGIEMNFRVETNTRFDEIDKLINSKKSFSDKDSNFIKLFYKQMSDIHLKVCQKYFYGYIGTIERNLTTAKLDMDFEDFAATKLIKLSQ